MRDAIAAGIGDAPMPGHPPSDTAAGYDGTSFDGCPLTARDHRHAVPPGFAAQSSGSPGSACAVAYPGCGLPPGPG